MRNRGLGELPADYRRQGPLLDPNGPEIGAYENKYTATQYPFVVGLSSIQVIPSNPYRCYVLIQNKDSVNNMFVSFGTNATAFGSIIIVPEGNYELIGGGIGGAFCPNNSVYVLGTVAGQSGVLVEGVLPPV